MTDNNNIPRKRQQEQLTELISIRLSKEQKAFIEENKIAVGEWLRQIINDNMGWEKKAK